MPSRPYRCNTFYITLTSDKRFAFYRLIDVQPGDSVYARLVSTDDHPLPRIFLSDFGGKPLTMGDIDRSANAITFTYHSREPTVGPILNIDGSNTITVKQQAITDLQWESIPRRF